MIVLAPGYTGFTKIALCIKEKLGSLGETNMRELFVYGSSKYECSIVISDAIPNADLLLEYLADKTGLSVEMRSNAHIANKYWLSLHRALREDVVMCRKIIVMTYSTLNDLIVWNS